MTIEELIEHLKTFPDQKMPIEIGEDGGWYESRTIWVPFTEDHLYFSKKGKTLRIG